MIAIITGDIINSGAHGTAQWNDILKKECSKWGQSPTEWEVYRGDEFQLKVPPGQALCAAIQIKSQLKSLKGLDVRMAIGIGMETFEGARISESNGSAYQRSGRTFGSLKADKLNIAITSGNQEIDQTLNLMLRLALDFMDHWTPVSAEIVTMALQHPQLSQREIAQMLHIQQSAVSQRQKRARLHLVLDLLGHYAETVKNIKP